MRDATGSISVVHVVTCRQLQGILDGEKIEACIIYSARVVANGNGKGMRNTARTIVSRYGTGARICLGKGFTMVAVGQEVRR